MAERALWALCLGALFLICALALREGVRASGDLDWPGDPDLFRDIAQSQTFLQGNWDGDPYYRHGKLWYSPLVPAAVAVGSRLTNSPTHRLYARAGAYLNLLAPLCFFALVAQFFTRGAALAAVFSFVFLSGQNLPAFASATYSPWLFPGLFAQSFFFLSLIALRWAWSSQSHLRYGIAGFVCGVTFLAHAAPAVILVAIVASIAFSAEPGPASATSRRALSTQWLALLLSAVAVSSPLLWTIAVHYGLRTRNPGPGSWQWPLLYWRELAHLASVALSWATAAAFLGALVTWRRRKGSFEARVLGVWAIACVLWIGYGYLTRVLASSIALPRALPSHHFVFYLKALESVFFGVGVAAVCGFLTGRLGGRFGVRLAPDALVSALVVALVALHYPSYRERPDFTLSRRKAERFLERNDRLAAFDWIAKNTEPEAVFLCEDDLSLYVVGPAGRKVVAADRFFSNPYLDWNYRNRRRNRMLRCLADEDEPCFRALASQHEVAYVLVESGEITGLENVAFIEKLFERGRVRIYGVRRSSAPADSSSS
ncbi:MAG TPA: hypothetical protein VJ921_03415 [Vicinamibacteria bacterium]|nr:hypothetical protein [Vicinamibacteria bacterium]